LNTQVHGIELGEDGKPTWLRFGILRLVYHLYCANSAEQAVQGWLQRLHSDAFRYHASHFQQCFWKFDRAAGHVARCRDIMDGALGRFSERVRRGEEVPLSDPDRLAMDEVNIELPLFLDAMFFYLRIQADAYAKLVTFFYPGRDTGKICCDSFRGQLKWFTKKRTEFDPEYATVLLANRRWFDLLAGDDPKGLRDVVVHHGGMLQVGWTKPMGGPIEPRTALFRSDGVIEENVFGALQEITAGWYAFLDAALYHFAPRLAGAGVLSTMSVNDMEKTRYLDCSEGEARGLWVYPAFTEAKVPQATF
jgi:hypothetical protein